MANFRFRAEVALDQRRQEELEALRDWRHAEAQFRVVFGTLTAEESRREAAHSELTRLERQGTDVETLLWHRNWIVRLRSNVDRLQRDLDDRARNARQAQQVWREARRRRLTLERMKARAWQRFQAAQVREETKAMDELARIRYVMSNTWRTDT